MHAGFGKARVGFVGLVREVDYPRHDHRRAAVFQQIDFLRELRIAVRELGQQVAYRPCDAVTLRLAGDDHRVELYQPFDEACVLLPDLRTLRIIHDFGTECRIVLGERVVAFDLEARLVSPGDAMEEDGFLDR